MAVRLNITMDEDIYARLKQEVPPRKISTFHLLCRLPGRSERALAERTGGRLEEHGRRRMAQVRKLPRRGDVYWVALDPTIGSEISKIRPAVIVSNNSCNTFGTRVVVLSLTSNVDSGYPGEALVVINGKPARVLGDQIRSLDKSRLRSRIDTLSREELTAGDEALRITLALQP